MLFLTKQRVFNYEIWRIMFRSKQIKLEKSFFIKEKATNKKDENTNAKKALLKANMTKRKVNKNNFQLEI